MKSQPAILFLFLFFILSCRKETPQADAGPKITNPTDYLLVSQTWTGPTSNGLSYILSYNDENLLSDAEDIQWWGGSTANGDTSYLHFEYSNGLCQKWTETHNGATGSAIYEYNSKGLPVKVVFYNYDTYYKTDRYEYDSDDRLVRVVDSSWQLNFIYEYSYDDHGNPAILNKRSLTDSTKTRNEWTSYDDKVNCLRAVNGLPTESILYSDINSYYSSMLHNVLTNNYTAIGFINSTDPPTTEQYQYQYQYNEQGLPTQIVSGPWIITNTYRKYK
jgi:hypothetical protein